MRLNWIVNTRRAAILRIDQLRQRKLILILVDCLLAAVEAAGIGVAGLGDGVGLAGAPRTRILITIFIKIRQYFQIIWQ